MRHRLVCVVSLFLAGCGLDQSEQTPPAAHAAFAQPKPHLHAGMTDDTILRALGLDPARMRARSDAGPDGYSSTYSGHRGESVLITRSIVTGVFVMQSGPSGSRSWELRKS